MPAKQGVARNGPLTVVNNFQFLNVDLTPDEIDAAISSSCLCKVDKKENSSVEFVLVKDDEVLSTISSHDVAVHLLKNTHGIKSNKTSFWLFYQV